MPQVLTQKAAPFQTVSEKDLSSTFNVNVRLLYGPAFHEPVRALALPTVHRLFPGKASVRQRTGVPTAIVLDLG